MKLISRLGHLSHDTCLPLIGVASLIAIAGCATTKSTENPSMLSNTSSAVQKDSDCPPAAPLMNREGWAPATRATYTAKRVGADIHITAAGENNTGGWQNVLAMNPTRIFPPQLTHWQKPPDGMATQAITPFNVCVKLNVGDEKVRSIRVFFADGQEDIAVAEKK